jgi:hypothetical protein
MTGRRNADLQGIADQALMVGDIVSAVIFVVAPGSTDLELGAAAGVEGPPLDALVAAVQNPAHPVTRAMSDAGPSFDVEPMAPGGARLRSHLPLPTRTTAGTIPTGVLAVAHDSPVSEADRRQLVALASRAGEAIAGRS